MLSAGLTSVAGALYAMMFGFVDPESGLGILISVENADHGGARRRGAAVRAADWRCHPVPLEEISNNLLGGKGAGLTFVRLRRHHRADRALPAGGILTLINRLWARRGKSSEPSFAKGAAHAP